jgi:hypothetical protein
MMTRTVLAILLMLGIAACGGTVGGDDGNTESESDAIAHAPQQGGAGGCDASGGSGGGGGGNEGSRACCRSFPGFWCATDLR